MTVREAQTAGTRTPGKPGYFTRDAGFARADARGRLRETAAVACP
jgi:hypothetical protein